MNVMQVNGCISSTKSSFSSPLLSASGRATRKYGSRVSLKCTCENGLRLRPVKSCTDAVLQARRALRNMRESLPIEPVVEDELSNTEKARDPSLSIPLATPATPNTRWRVHLPTTIPTNKGWKSREVAEVEDLVHPGGMQQQFRYLQPLVDELLEGYDAQFLGMLESEADGVGVWSVTDDMTVVANVCTPTFDSFTRLCCGFIGSRVMRADHTLLLVNCTWGDPEDVGNIWNRDLRKRVQEIMEWEWQDLYRMEPIVTVRGNKGRICCNWPDGYAVFACSTEELSQAEKAAGLESEPVCVRRSAKKISLRDARKAIDEYVLSL